MKYISYKSLEQLITQDVPYQQYFGMSMMNGSRVILKLSLVKILWSTSSVIQCKY